MSPSWIPSLQDELDALEHQALRRRCEPLAPGAGATVTTIQGEELLSFASNDYLGLAGDPALREAVVAELAHSGVGGGAAPLLGGHRPAHEALEEGLAAWLGREAALLFGSGYLANLGMLAALAGAGDVIYLDRLAHASLLDGLALAGARWHRYRHGDVAHLETLLRRHPGAGRRLIVTDGVFSMDGDLAPLGDLAALADRFDALLVVDDAHGLGVLGREGRGSVDHFALGEGEVPLLMGTLGKAFGVYGAFVAGPRVLIEVLRNRARTFIYHTALPPLVAAAAGAALARVRADGWRRERLVLLARTLRDGLMGTPWRLLDSITAIQPLVVGPSRGAVDLSRRLRERGFHVPAVRPPTVPKGTSRLRISLSAAHRPEDVGRLAAALRELA